VPGLTVPADGEPDGFAYYDPKDRWNGMRSAGILEVEELVATSAVAEIVGGAGAFATSEAWQASRPARDRGATAPSRAPVVASRHD